MKILSIVCSLLVGINYAVIIVARKLKNVPIVKLTVRSYKFLNHKGTVKLYLNNLVCVTCKVIFNSIFKTIEFYLVGNSSFFTNYEKINTS